MDIPHTNIRWHFPVNQRWSLRFRGAIPGHGAHAAQVSRHGAQLPTLTWNFEAPYGGENRGHAENWLWKSVELDADAFWAGLGETLAGEFAGSLPWEDPINFTNFKKFEERLLDQSIYRNLS